MVNRALENPLSFRPIPTEELTGNPPPTDVELRRWMKGKKIPVLERLDHKGRLGGLAAPLCCVGSCMEAATWRFASAPPVKLPYCDRHLPVAASAPQWEVSFNPRGKSYTRLASSYALLKVIEQGFVDGAGEATVRRAP